ncbi:MAG: hypothetical protein IPM18_17640 [Phycisphaerales bacterium]|nr:hypothetical protein [Phycisphaerales bacterium]
MFATLSETLLADSAGAAGILLGLYWFGLIVGGGLLLLSVFSGGDHDLGVDSDVAVGDFDISHTHGLSHTVAALSTWFSLNFVVFSAALFGAFGLVLSYLSTLSPWLAFGVALGGGLLLGQGAHQLMRLVRRTSGDSATQPQDYVHKLARVTIAIAPHGKGEVALQVRGGERYVPALSDAGNGFAAGDEVVVVGYRAGIAYVVSRTEYRDRVQAG